MSDGTKSKNLLIDSDKLQKDNSTHNEKQSSSLQIKKSESKDSSDYSREIEIKDGTEASLRSRAMPTRIPDLAF